ncbi:unnamed protein product [Schistosoma curassoni]|uniref:Uncharacterized protein n=1 Tax=Schistosoma curassoni TaxID=6186 RepID=A0A183JVP5_9TREM|nr:unnamed protein product [Schistosoma curassoni]
MIKKYLIRLMLMGNICVAKIPTSQMHPIVI